MFVICNKPVVAVSDIYRIADDSDDEEIADMVRNIGFHEMRKSSSAHAQQRPAVAEGAAGVKVSPSGSSVGSDEDHK